MSERHFERKMLFQLLKAESFSDTEDVIFNLIATMDPKDVELVQKRIAELKEKNK